MLKEIHNLSVGYAKEMHHLTQLPRSQILSNKVQGHKYKVLTVKDRNTRY